MNLPSILIPFIKYTYMNIIAYFLLQRYAVVKLLFILAANTLITYWKMKQRYTFIILIKIIKKHNLRSSS